MGRLKEELMGKRFGKLVVISYYKYIKCRHHWTCKCDCGNLINLFAGHLKNQARSCGCSNLSNRVDLTNKEFGVLKVLEFSEILNSVSYWKVQCKCGLVSIKPISALRPERFNDTCGWNCKFREYKEDFKPHRSYTEVSLNNGKATKTYQAWANMLQRCTNSHHPQYKYYGGRGIVVCEDWKYFPNFIRDMGDAPIGLTLDRIDNNLGYHKDNCRWTTMFVQANNRRKKDLGTY